MSKLYSQSHIITENLGNNSFAWDERTHAYGQSPTLTIPTLIDGTLSDVRVGEDIVFEEMEDGVLRSCTGLRNFVRLRHCDEGSNPVSKKDIPNIVPGSLHPKGTSNPALRERGATSRGQIQTEIAVFDNHNHALYFWLDAVRTGIIETGFELIHIDEHSDLGANEHDLDVEKAITDPEYAWDFTNLSCNVGNYIVPALRSGLIGTMIRIENEYQIDEYMDYLPSENSVLNLDIDIFAPELDHIPSEKKIAIIKKLMKQVKYVTIATSPYFIEQGLAIEKLHLIMQ